MLDGPVNPTEENDSVAYPAARYTSASVVAELGKRSETCFTVWVVGYREVWIDAGDGADDFPGLLILRDKIVQRPAVTLVPEEIGIDGHHLVRLVDAKTCSSVPG